MSPKRKVDPQRPTQRVGSRSVPPDHIKVYGNAGFLRRVSEAAAALGMSQSAYCKRAIQDALDAPHGPSEDEWRRSVDERLDVLERRLP